MEPIKDTACGSKMFIEIMTEREIFSCALEKCKGVCQMLEPVIKDRSVTLLAVHEKYNLLILPTRVK